MVILLNWPNSHRPWWQIHIGFNFSFQVGGAYFALAAYGYAYRIVTMHNRLLTFFNLLNLHSVTLNRYYFVAHLKTTHPLLISAPHHFEQARLIPAWR
jgi:hypothetical protein